MEAMVLGNHWSLQGCFDFLSILIMSRRIISTTQQGQVAECTVQLGEFHCSVTYFGKLVL